ncbi:MAG: 4Fe-4S binding protein [Chloroflexi bacterium]|nr:4Fe-4S binding protein [Chloroflexota bacterium]
MTLRIISIDRYRCIGCTACEQACPNDVIRMRGGKAVPVYPEDCSQCFSCEVDCPHECIVIGPVEGVA